MKHEAVVKVINGIGTSKFDRGTRVVEDAWAVCPCGWRTSDGKHRSILERDTVLTAQAKADQHNLEAN